MAHHTVHGGAPAAAHWDPERAAAVPGPSGFVKGVRGVPCGGNRRCLRPGPGCWLFLVGVALRNQGLTILLAW